MKDRRQGRRRSGVRASLIAAALWALVVVIGLGASPDAALAQSADAADPELEVDAWALFGAIAEHRWAPIVVDLENRGRGRDLALRVTTPGMPADFEVEVELPRGGEKRVPVLVPAMGSLNDLRLRLAVLEDGRELLTREIQLPKADQGLAVVVADAEGDLEGISGIVQNRGRVAVLRPSDLPDTALSWSSVDQVVLAGGGWRMLADAQGEALRQWVALGGHLVVIGGAEAAQYLEALPEPMRPATLVGTRQAAQLRALGLLDSGPGPRGAITLAELDARSGTSSPLPEQDGLDLAVRGAYGDGAVTALAFDPGQALFRQWGGMDEVWAALRFTPPPGTAWTEPAPDASVLSSSVGQLPEFELPSMGSVMLLIVLYIILVGPVNYRVLQRRKRLDLAWLTIPALTLLATAGTYGMGLRLHGRSLMVYELALVRAVPQAGVAHVYSYVSLFSPAPRSYEIDFEGAQVIPVVEPGRARGRLTVAQGRSGRVEGFEMDQWSMRGVMAEAVIPWPAATAPALQLESTRVEGETVNFLSRDLEDAIVVVPGGFARQGDVKQGQPIPVTAAYRPDSTIPMDPGLEWDGLRAGMVAVQLGGGDRMVNGYVGAANRRPTVAFPARRRADAVLLGFSTEPVLEVEVRGGRGEHRRESLISGNIPIVLGGEAGQLRFVEGQAARRSTLSDRRCDKSSATFDYADREAVFHFNLGDEGLLPAQVYLSIVGEEVEPKVIGMPDVYDLPPAEVDDVVVGAFLDFDTAVWDAEQAAWIDFDRLKPFETKRIPRLITRVEGRDEIRLRLRASATFPDREVETFETARLACWEPKLSIGDREARP